MNRFLAITTALATSTCCNISIYCQAFSISHPGIATTRCNFERSRSRNEIRVRGIASNDVSDFSLSQKLSDLNITSSADTMIQQVKEVVSGKKEVIKKKTGIMGHVFRRIVAPELREDFGRRMPHYLSDWTDGFKMKRQTIPAVLFLYFACLTPAVSFGTIANEITNGSIGVVEFLLSCGLSGIAYSVLCGQPMAFLAPTGLTLAFISGLYRFCTVAGVPFMPIYTWVGLWTGLFMSLLAIRGSSKLIRYCTRFTDEVFNALLSINFVYEACKSLRRNFVLAADPMNLTMPFVALSMAISTFWMTMKAQAIRTSVYFNEKTRTIIKNFGPVAIIIVTSLFNQLPTIKKFAIPTLKVPNTFELSNGRDLLVPFMALPTKLKLLSSLPALLLTSLFFMDQNISVRVVNNPDNKLKKGEAYNMDMLALGLITAVASIFGMPWMCGATVQSVNHVKALAKTTVDDEGNEVVVDVIETRLTGFVIHALIASTIFLLPLLRSLPIPVVSGVFLFLGRKLMTGNTFLQRIKALFVSPSKLPKNHPVHIVGRRKMNAYTLLQFACLYGIWAFKQCSSTAIFFPSVIGLLMLIRSEMLPHFFKESDFVALKDESP